MTSNTSLPSRTSRRAFLRTGAGGLTAATLAACSRLSTSPQSADDGDGATPSGPSSSHAPKESPVLATRVSAGSLPPLDKRLPARPFVQQTVERPGVYGGTWHTATLGPADVYWIVQCVGMETDTLAQWDYDLHTIGPQVAESFEISPDATTFTFRLRTGMRWSDGAPFTVEDILFAENDCNNYSSDLSAAIGETPDPARKAEKVDDHTVRITLERPDATFLGVGQTSKLQALINKPKHYLKKFHEKYNPKAGELAKQHNVSSWMDLLAMYGSWDSIWTNPDLPTVISAWVLKQGYGQGTQVIFERNPYYYKVDGRGAQLPYLDRIVFDVISDTETMLLQATNGKFDMHMRHFNIPRNKPVLARSRDKGGYHFFDTTPGYMNATLLMLNLSHKDPVQREIFNNRDFRVGLSLAIDRPQIIDTVFARQGDPWQAAPSRSSDYYDRDLATQFATYDEAQAGRHLDRAGYARRDSHGRRLGPDGRPITITLEFATQIMPFWVDTVDLVKHYWEKVGITTEIKAEDRSLLYQRNLANEGDAYAWWGIGGAQPMAKSGSYLPNSTGYLRWAPGWADWYTSGGKDGVRPPEAARRQLHLWDELRGTGNAESRRRLMTEILRIAREQFWIIGIVTYPPGYGIANNNFHNIPKTIYNPADFKSPLNACQFFIKD